LLHSKQAERGGRSVALPIIICVTRRVLVVSAMPQLLYLQEAGWAWKINSMWDNQNYNIMLENTYFENMMKFGCLGT
jgi:hypothetical protein